MPKSEELLRMMPDIKQVSKADNLKPKTASARGEYKIVAGKGTNSTRKENKSRSCTEPKTTVEMSRPKSRDSETTIDKTSQEAIRLVLEPRISHFIGNISDQSSQRI